MRVARILFCRDSKYASDSTILFRDYRLIID